MDQGSERLNCLPIDILGAILHHVAGGAIITLYCTDDRRLISQMANGAVQRIYLRQ
jgi:hypothetical protein